MAKAFERASKRVNAVNEAFLAELIQRDVQQLTEAALEKGVTAYLERPVKRERLNERFLQSTIRGVQSSNRRAQEAELWSVHRKRRRQQGGRDSSQTAESSEEDDRREGTPPAQHQRAAQQGVEQGQGLGELEVLELLARKRVKGRGAIGSRADEPGPFLPAPPQGFRDDDGGAATAARPAQGPALPLWAQQQRDDEAAAAAQAAAPSRAAVVEAATAAMAAAAARKERKKGRKKKRKEKAAKEGKAQSRKKSRKSELSDS